MVLSIVLNIPRIFQYEILCENFSNQTIDIAVNETSTVPTRAVTSGDGLVVVGQSITTALATVTVSAARNIRRRPPNFRLSDFGSHVVFEVIYSNALYTSLVLILPLLLLVGVNTKLIIELQVNFVHVRHVDSRSPSG